MDEISPSIPEMLLTAQSEASTSESPVPAQSEVSSSEDEERLHRMIRRLISLYDPQPLFEEILDAAIAIQKAQFGSLQIYDPKTGSLQIVAHRGLSQDFLEHFREAPADFSAYEQTVGTRERVVIEDVETDPGFEPHRQLAASSGFRSLYSGPLLGRRDQLLGVVSTHFRLPHRPSEQELELTDVYLKIAAEMIERRDGGRRLFQSEERLRGIIDCSPNPIFFKDLKGRYLLMNRVFAKILHLEPKLYLGKCDNDIFSPNESAALRAHDYSVLRSGQAQEFEERLALEDGLHIFRVHKFPVWNPEGEICGLAGVGTDITSRRQAEADLDVMMNVIRKLNSTFDLDVLLESLCIETMKLVGAEGGCAGLRSPGGLVSKKYFRGSKLVPLEYTWPPLHGLPGWVLVHKVPYVTNDALRDDQVCRELCEQFGVRSAVSIPIAGASGDVIGFFELHNKKDEEDFADADIQKLLAVSQVASVAIHNSLSQQKIRKAEAALLEATSNTLVSNLDLPALIEAISIWLSRITSFNEGRLSLLAAGGTLAQEWDLTSLSNGQTHEASSVPLDQETSGWVVQSHRPLVLNRIEAKADSQSLLGRLIAKGMRSACWLPLTSSENVLGTLCLASVRGNAFPAETVDFLSQIADRAAWALGNVVSLLQTSLKDIVGESPALKQTLQQLEIVAPTDATVLLLGETGTGKERFARAIHNLSGRREKRLITVNCSAIPAGLLESELFGHERGAFTGAICKKTGRVELAHKGTLFLDEIGDMPLELQSKLLRLLQEREFERLGSTQTISADVRVIAATNRDLAQMAADGQFRKDLYYRLKVFPIRVPPLRERTGDIPLLVRYFVQQKSQLLGKRIDTIPERAMEALSRWSWPGNVRELENFIERSVILSRGPELEVPSSELTTVAATESPSSSDPSLSAAERDLILQALRETGGVIGGPHGAATRLGLKRTTLNARMRKLNIQRKNLPE